MTPEISGQQSSEPFIETEEESLSAEGGQTTARSRTELESSQQAIRDATKWLVAAAAAVGAVVVAGLQLKDLPNGSLATSVAFLGVGAALLAIVFILYCAAGVLTAGYTTFGELTDLTGDPKYSRQMRKAAEWDKRLGPHNKQRHSPKVPPNEYSKNASQTVRRWYHTAAYWAIYSARGLSLRHAKDEDLRIDELISYLNVDTFFFTQGLAANINQLSRELRSTDKEILSLRGQRAGTVQDQDEDLREGEDAGGSFQDSDRRALLEKADWRREHLESAMVVLIAFANQRLLERRFRKLLLAIRFGGAVVVIGAAAFAAAPKLGEPQPLSIGQPIPVTITVVGNHLGKSCPPNTVLRGVAIGGTWEQPIVVTEKAGACPAQQATIDHDQAIVVPVVARSASAAS